MCMISSNHEQRGGSSYIPKFHFYFSKISDQLILTGCTAEQDNSQYPCSRHVDVPETVNVNKCK